MKSSLFDGRMLNVRLVHFSGKVVGNLASFHGYIAVMGHSGHAGHRLL